MRSRILPALALLVVAVVCVTAAAAQGLPDAALDAVPGGQTSVLGSCFVAIAYLGKLLLSRNSPSEYARLVDENKDLRSELRAERDRYVSLLTQRAAAP